jgi:hypothetical protein
MLTIAGFTIRYSNQRRSFSMPDAKINGETTKPMPASIRNAMARGIPKTTAQAKGPKPVSTVRVG